MNLKKNGKNPFNTLPYLFTCAGVNINEKKELPANELQQFFH